MNAWIADLNLIAGTWFDAMTRATWQGAIVLALVWIVSRGIAAMPARCKSWLWRLAFLKLLIALVWITPISLALLPAKTVTIPPTGPVLEDIAPASSSVNSLAFADLSPVPEPRTVIGWRAWLLMVWVIGLGGGVTRLGIQWHSAYRLRRASLPLPDPTCQESLVRLARAFRLRRIPALRQTETAASPLLVGIYRPTIILPSHILRSCSEAQLEMMLAHELAHLRRRDLWWLWFFALCEILFFFHPFVWLVRREWNLAAESACDELAVRVTRGAPSDYGAKLIDIVAQMSTQRPIAHMLAAGMSETATTLQRRLQAMTAKKNPIAIVAAIAFMIVGALTLVPCRLVAQALDADTLDRLKEENAKLKQQLDTTRQEIEALRQQSISARQRVESAARRTAEQALPIVNKITITNIGPQVASDAFVRAKLGLKEGDVYSADAINAGVENLHRSGYFPKVQVIEEATPGGVNLTCILLGKPRITAQQLDSVRRELDGLLTRLAENHPDVIAKRLELEGLQRDREKQMSSEQPDIHLDLSRPGGLGVGRKFVPAKPGQRSPLKEERELLLEEIKLAERQVQWVNKKLENGKGTFDELLRVQRELLDLKLQLAELEGSKAEQRAVLLQQLKVAERLQKEQRFRVEVGTLDADGAISSEREVLRIKRALAPLE